VHQRRITAESLRRADVLNAVALPQSIGTAEGRQPTLGRNAGTRENKDVRKSNHPCSEPC
jgi:hypothetical protein